MNLAKTTKTNGGSMVIGTKNTCSQFISKGFERTGMRKPTIEINMLQKQQNLEQPEIWNEGICDGNQNYNNGCNNDSKNICQKNSIVNICRTRSNSLVSKTHSEDLKNLRADTSTIKFGSSKNVANNSPISKGRFQSIKESAFKYC